MSKPKSRKLRKSLFSSYFTTTLSIAMILFLFGLLGLLLINARKLSDYVMENIGVTLILKDGSREADVLKLQKQLETTSYIKSTKYIDKATAADELKKELGEDFTNFLGYNPLLSSIDVNVYANYANPDSLVKIEKQFMAYPEVQEVYYQRDLVRQLHANVSKISMILLGLCIVMFLIFAALINNMIRLSVYSKRFIINTMQLVGATRSFIRRPFMFKGILYGIYGAIIACFMFLAIFVSYQKELQLFVDFQNPDSIAMLAGGLFVLGIFISGTATFFAVNKFLRLKFDQLFY
jgi:cell division transport system permease protein